ncbi:TetR/AcrR family transcriptional regulator [Kocuria sp. LUK]|uniref:TetR family transcriptional regulator n=1 Tax=Kocuria flava TaxID=446860 RepID=A0A2N4T2G1_9MICC|nr:MULTISPECIES: TetR/AcrR family transcriptional regulator [Kocuria]MCD1145773.1 TetR/AcrR family transcriptional regulator [Kocuria sp. LUK]PLC12410.1 TetR family transcriptional regulator [Kocuria flava]
MTNETRRGRPARLPREARRRQLLETALTVFSANGYHGSSMDDIADAAQVSKPVLYQHFPGKRELYLALVDHHLGELSAALVAALRGSEVNRERVESMLDVYFGYVEANPEAHRLIFESDLLADPEVAERFERFHGAVAEAIAAVLGPNAGLSRPHAVLVARSLTGMAQTAAVHWNRNPDTGGRAEAQRQIFRLAWGGISVIDEDWE